MNLDTIIHPVRAFAELDNEDVAAFLRDRTFKSEGPELEVKSSFPSAGKEFDIGEICKDIVAFLNAEGGLIVYGVSDGVNDPNGRFPDYLPGLAHHPSPEDVSRWAKQRIYPPVELPPMRVFDVAGRKVAVLKVPSGIDKPYCRYDPGSHGVWYFKREGDRLFALTPAEIREAYIAALVEQASWLLRSGELTRRATEIQAATRRQRLEAHRSWVKTKLEDPQEFGFVGVYTLPAQPVDIPWRSLREFLTQNRTGFSSELRRSGEPEVLQNGVSVGYFPKAIRQDIKSTYRTTLYVDGLVALDSQADHIMDRGHRMGGGKVLHPYWLSYELQRHLQLSRAVLEPWDVDRAEVIVELENIEDFSLAFQGSSSYVVKSPYSGSHGPIEREIRLSDIYPHDGEKRNIAIPVVKDIMGEVCRILSEAQPPALWDEKGYLTYVKGSESSR
jgi:hypothetical protein